MNNKCILFIMILLFVDCKFSHSYRNEEQVVYCEQTFTGKYPYDKSIKFEMIHQGKRVPFFIFINMIKGKAVSLEISQPFTQNDNKTISYKERIAFVSAVFEKLKDEELLFTLTRIYTRYEFWQNESEKMTQDYLQCENISKVLDESRLKSDLKKNLAQYGMKIIDCTSDNPMLESVQSTQKDKTKEIISSILHGDIAFEIGLN